MDVKEFFEKSLSFGLGLAAYSKEKIEDLVEEMVRRGEVSRTEARDFASKLTQKGEEQRDDHRKNSWHPFREEIRERTENRCCDEREEDGCEDERRDPSD